MFKSSKRSFAVVQFIVLLFFTSSIWGASYRGFVYEDRGEFIAIMGYSGGLEREIEIPAEIVGKPVRVIATSAFHSKDMEIIYVPEGVTLIEESVFVGSKLVQIYLPSTVVVHPLAFIFSRDLENIEVVEQNPLYQSIDGSLYNKDATELIFTSPRKAEGDEGFVIPESVQMLGDQAFRESSVSKVIFPPSVRTIGLETFRGSDLESISIPSSVTEIGKMAFWECRSLSAIDVDGANPNFSSLAGVLLDKGSTSIILYPQAKPGVSYSISDGVVTIQAGAISLPTELEELIIPQSVSEIIATAIEINGTKITVVESNTSYRSVEGVLFSDDMAELISFPKESMVTDYQVPAGVKTINERAFADCDNLITVTLPEGVTVIEEEAFLGCADLVTVNLPSSLVEIKYQAFRSCRRLVNIELPSNLESIGEGAFRLCGDLVSISIPEGVTLLEDLTFSSCTDLSSLALPSTLGSIGDETFASCRKLESIVLPEGLVEIGNEAFSSCTLLEEINLPDSVNVIGEGAFFSCRNLTTVIIPHSVTRIESSTFYNCIGLLDFKIPENVNYIGSTVFYGCSAIEGFEVAENNAFFTAEDGVLFSAGKERLVQFPLGKDSVSFTVPDGVVTIDEAAFRTTSLASIILPSTLTSIGNNAFESCGSLKNILLPDGLTYIGERAFSECVELTSVNIPSSLSYLAEGTFNENRSLLSIKIPGTVKFIEKEAFNRCSELKEIIIDEGVLYIGNGAFRFCVSFFELLLPVGLEKIDERAFELCVSLLQIHFPEGLISICSESFSGCELLETIQFPSTLLSIGDSAFENCEGLTEVTFPASLQKMGNRAFILSNNIESFYFLGDAPGPIGVVFARDIDGGTVYFFDDAIGFTSPTWAGLPTVNLGPRSGSGFWLIDNHLTHDTDLESAPFQSEIPLLVNYALDQRPDNNVLPQLNLSESEITVSFFGARDDISYFVELSKDLSDWTTTGVTLSEPDGNGMRTASLNLQDGRCFVRFRVTSDS